MVVVVTEELAGPDEMHVEPARWESNKGDRELPAVLSAVGRERLDVDPCAWRWIEAVDIESSVVKNVDDNVRHLAGNS